MEQIFESRVGKYFVVFFALFALLVYAYVFFCTGDTCFAYIVLPIMPWAFILVEDLGIGFTWAMYPVFVLLNASVAYVIGATIEWTYNRYLDHKEAGKLKILNKGDVTQSKT